MAKKTEQIVFPMQVIAHIHTPYKSKFGIPRQSGLVTEGISEIVFLPKYRNPDALRGIEGYSHLWLIWQFSEVFRDRSSASCDASASCNASTTCDASITCDAGKDWSPTVRPPRLGGNTRMGVFATRSPNRPNPIGLSSVMLDGVEYTKTRGAVLRVRGADLLDGTPIFDIKPYLPFTDSHPDAMGGFADAAASYALNVDFPPALADAAAALLTPEDIRAVTALLAGDPRPSYKVDSDRVYGMEYGGCDIRFTVSDGCAHVCSIERMERKRN